MDQKIKVLLVDDEPSLLRSLQRLLRRNGFEVEMASSGQAALEILETKPVDVILTDFKMPGMNGADLLNVVAGRFPDTRRVLMSGCAIVQVDAAFIPKPFDQDQLVLVCKKGRLR